MVQSWLHRGLVRVWSSGAVVLCIFLRVLPLMQVFPRLAKAAQEQEGSRFLQWKLKGNCSEEDMDWPPWPPLSQGCASRDSLEFIGMNSSWFIAGWVFCGMVRQPQPLIMAEICRRPPALPHRVENSTCSSHPMLMFRQLWHMSSG